MPTPYTEATKYLNGTLSFNEFKMLSIEAKTLLIDNAKNYAINNLL